MAWTLETDRTPYRYQGNVNKLLIRDPEAIAQFSDDIFVGLHFG
jgi:hypothetical protein